MFRIAVTAALAILAVACSDADQQGGAVGSASYDAMTTAGMPAPPPPPPAPMMMAREAKAEMSAPADMGQSISPNIQQPSPGGGQPAQLIAYTYNYGFKVPPLKMEGLLNAHKAACETAGPANCYVINSQINGIGTENSGGYLQLRGTPAWVKTFQTSMADSLKPFDADLDSNNDSAEDLTVQIVDSEARLRSMKTMRDRLQELLRDRPGRLSDLLEIEREFARVQADIDSHESILAALRLRVSMSIMSLSYMPKYEAASESIWRPLGNAFGNFVPNMANTLAELVEWLGFALPTLILLGFAVWLLWWFFRRRGKAKKAKANPLAPKPAAPPTQT